MEALKACVAENKASRKGRAPAADETSWQTRRSVSCWDSRPELPRRDVTAKIMELKERHRSTASTSLEELKALKQQNASARPTTLSSSP